MSLCRGSNPLHIRARLCLWSGSLSLLDLSLLSISNIPFQWESFLQHWAVLWDSLLSKNHSLWGHPFNSRDLGSEVASLLLLPASFFFLTLLCPHTINPFSSGIPVTSPLNSFCCKIDNVFCFANPKGGIQSPLWWLYLFVEHPVALERPSFRLNPSLLWQWHYGTTVPSLGTVLFVGSIVWIYLVCVFAHLLSLSPSST